MDFSLTTLGRGAAIERFDEEMQKVLDNILDPNTKPDVMREVKLIVKVKPNKERDFAYVEIHCQSKLAPFDAVPTQIYIGKHKGKAVAFERNPQQLHALDEEHNTKVLKLMKEEDDA